VSAKLISVAVLLLLPALTEAQPAVPCSVPLSEAGLTTLVRNGSPARISQLVANCGIDFEPDGEAIGRLRSAGAQERVLTAVRSARRSPTAVTPGAKKVNTKDGLRYVWIPPGTFMMGCSPGDSECFDDEKPAHQVTITKGFWLGQTPVTQQAYRRVTGQDPSRFKGANLPVETVNWDGAQSYCAAIGGRLPTEAEWEYAVRAGSTGARYGNLDEVAWYSGNSGNKTHEVGQKQANAFGLFDMLGNVWQWVADWYGDYPSAAQSDPSGAGSGQFRALRGGSWGGNARFVRVSYRSRDEPGNRVLYIGLRCVGE
jgi:formylglycine-generating enzyme required for sulfatase activity